VVNDYRFVDLSSILKLREAVAAAVMGRKTELKEKAKTWRSHYRMDRGEVKHAFQID
jgi:hypothetical protein